ncbi:chitotriosidase-1-like [Ornithodoros turicata]|uniref:chitotriosidase-1-like n=1 Tax=Ornithodoros turicata TaxID=34597 RepID=UPI00313972CC
MGDSDDEVQSEPESEGEHVPETPQVQEEQEPLPEQEPEPEPPPEPEPEGEVEQNVEQAVSNAPVEEAPVPHSPIPDTDEEDFDEVEEEEHSACYYVWVVLSVTFISLIVPLSIFFLPHLAFLAKHHTSPTPWQTVMPEREKKEDMMNATCGLHLVQDTAPYVTDNSLPPFNSSTTFRRHRTVFCVFDTAYHRSEMVYLPKNVPFTFCTYIIFYSVSLSPNGLTFKRPNMDPQYIEEFNTMKADGTLQHPNGDGIPLVITLGGDATDAENISKALRKPSSRTTAAHLIVRFLMRYELQGINIHWDHPKGQCGVAEDTEDLVSFIGELRNVEATVTSIPMTVIVTLPPLIQDLRLYAANKYADKVNYVAVATHRLLRGQNVVECKDRGAESNAIIHQVHVAISKFPHRKVCMSISVGPSTFTAMYPTLGTSGKTGAAIDPTTKQPGKAGYYKVCKMRMQTNTGDPECSINYDGPNVATFSSPENLKYRMQQTYDQGLGDICVVIFDMDLDDFAGECPRHGHLHSPLTATIISS